MITPPSAAAHAAARERLAALAKPLGALGRLEDAAAWVAACQGACPPRPLDRVRLTVLAPGDRVDLAEGAVERGGGTTSAPALLGTLLADLAAESGAFAASPRSPAAGSPPVRGLGLKVRAHEGATALVDIECPRDEFG